MVGIRDAHEGDLQALLGLTQAFATSFKTEESAFFVSARQLIRQEDAWLGVAEFEGHIVGYCLGFEHYTLYANGKVAWVEEVMVLEEQRRRGIGAELMAAFELWAKQRGAKLSALATRRAASFYEALGYEESAVFFRKLLTDRS